MAGDDLNERPAVEHPHTGCKAEASPDGPFRDKCRIECHWQARDQRSEGRHARGPLRNPQSPAPHHPAARSGGQAPGPIVTTPTITRIHHFDWFGIFTNCAIASSWRTYRGAWGDGLQPNGLGRLTGGQFREIYCNDAAIPVCHPDASRRRAVSDGDGSGAGGIDRVDIWIPPSWAADHTGAAPVTLSLHSLLHPLFPPRCLLHSSRLGHLVLILHSYDRKPARRLDRGDRSTIHQYDPGH